MMARRPAISVAFVTSSASVWVYSVRKGVVVASIQLEGFEKWALRYVSTCQPKQPSRQVTRALKWNSQLVGKLAANLN